MKKHLLLPLTVLSSSILFAQTITFDFTANTTGSTSVDANPGTTTVTQTVSGETLSISSAGGGDGRLVVMDQLAYFGWLIPHFSGRVFSMDLMEDITHQLTLGVVGGKNFDLRGFTILDIHASPSTTLVLTTNKGSVLTNFASEAIEATVKTFNDPVLQGVSSVTITRQGGGPFLISLDNIILENIGGSVLPLQLLSFTGEQTTSGNLLRWQTAAEANVKAFAVEKSLSGAFYSALDSVKAGDVAYQFLDRKAEGTSFYRLKMMDGDGSFRFSPVIAVQGRERGVALTVSPNPLRGHILRVKSAAHLSGEQQVAVVDAAGRTWYTGVLKSAELSTGGEISVEGLPAGMYFLQVGDKQTGKQEVVPFQKQ